LERPSSNVQAIIIAGIIKSKAWSEKLKKSYIVILHSLALGFGFK